jgi:hypothetical protein
MQQIKPVLALLFMLFAPVVLILLCSVVEAQDMIAPLNSAAGSVSSTLPCAAKSF